MTDIVTRLRALADELTCGFDLRAISPNECPDALCEAAEVLDALEKRIRYGYVPIQLERDDLKAKLAECVTQVGEWGTRAGKAEAEAAALRETLTAIADGHTHGYPDVPEDHPTRVKALTALSQPGPGAALLEGIQRADLVARTNASLVSQNEALRERVRKLEAVAESARRYFDGVDERYRTLAALAALEETP